jgi:hypothetical protein
MAMKMGTSAGATSGLALLAAVDLFFDPDTVAGHRKTEDEIN